MAPPAPEDAAAELVARKIIEKLLKTQRSVGSRVCASAINAGAMKYARGIGEPGANPRIVAKLLSPARWWGPGADAWHLHDRTWLCTDRRDYLGQVVEEQGRVLWHEVSDAGSRAAAECRSA